MPRSRWKPSKGREIDEIVDKLNELITKLNSQDRRETKKYQDIKAIKTDNGYKIQIRTEDGLVESDPTYVTGFKKV